MDEIERMSKRELQRQVRILKTDHTQRFNELLDSQWLYSVTLMELKSAAASVVDLAYADNGPNMRMRMRGRMGDIGKWITETRTVCNQIGNDPSVAVQWGIVEENASACLQLVNQTDTFLTESTDKAQKEFQTFLEQEWPELVNKLSRAGVEERPTRGRPEKLDPETEYIGDQALILSVEFGRKWIPIGKRIYDTIDSIPEYERNYKQQRAYMRLRKCRYQVRDTWHWDDQKLSTCVKNAVKAIESSIKNNSLHRIEG